MRNPSTNPTDDAIPGRDGSLSGEAYYYGFWRGYRDGYDRSPRVSDRVLYQSIRGKNIAGEDDFYIEGYSSGYSEGVKDRKANRPKSPMMYHGESGITKVNPGIPITHEESQQLIDYIDHHNLPAAWFDSYGEAQAARRDKIAEGGDYSIVERAMEGRTVYGVVPWQAAMVMSGRGFAQRNPMNFGGLESLRMTRSHITPEQVDIVAEILFPIGKVTDGISNFNNTMRHSPASTKKQLAALRARGESLSPEVRGYVAIALENLIGQQTLVGNRYQLRSLRGEGIYSSELAQQNPRPYNDNFPMVGGSREVAVRVLSGRVTPAQLQAIGALPAYVLMDSNKRVVFKTDAPLGEVRQVVEDIGMEITNVQAGSKQNPASIIGYLEDLGAQPAGSKDGYTLFSIPGFRKKVGVRSDGMNWKVGPSMGAGTTSLYNLLQREAAAGTYKPAGSSRGGDPEEEALGRAYRAMAKGNPVYDRTDKEALWWEIMRRRQEKEQKQNPPKFVAFTVDKNGKPIAYREIRSGGIRYVRINYDEAKMLVSTGQAQEVRMPKPSAVRNPGLSLWGLNRVTGFWEHIRGAESMESALQWKPYFEPPNDDRYSQVIISEKKPSQASTRAMRCNPAGPFYVQDPDVPHASPKRFATEGAAIKHAEKLIKARSVSFIVVLVDDADGVFKTEYAKVLSDGSVEKRKRNPGSSSPADWWNAMSIKERLDFLTGKGWPRAKAMTPAMSAYAELSNLERSQIDRLAVDQIAPKTDPYAEQRKRAQSAIDAAERRWATLKSQLTPKQRKDLRMSIFEWEGTLDLVKDIVQEDSPDIEERVKGWIMQKDPTVGGALAGNFDRVLDKGKKRNPASSAADVYEQFHGRPSEQTTEYRYQQHEHEHLSQLGQLVSLRIITPFNKEAEIAAPHPETAKEADIVQLCCSEDRTQLYFVGGDQEMPKEALEKMGFKEDQHDFKDCMLLGVLVEVTYRTQKGFDKFKVVDYYHELGEESGVEPVLLYDLRSGLLSVAGGQYEVRPEGIVN